MGNKKRARIIFFLLPVLIIVLAVSVTIMQRSISPNINPYYVVGSTENKEQLKEMFALLANKSNDDESRFALVRQIANNLAKAGEYSEVIHFLRGWTIDHPDDAYDSYYLLMIAYAYMQQNSQPMAMQYFDMIVKNYPDLTVSGESIHLSSFKHLIGMSDNWEQKIWYYNELISRFSDKIDLGTTWFNLGQAYEHVGDWTGAMQAYSRYLSLAGAAIPGFPDAQNYARRLVDFDNSPKDWTYESLPALLASIKTSLDTGNASRLRRSQSKINFFACTWEQRDVADTRATDINLYSFMQGNRIRFEDEVDSASNANEAFLRTWGWQQNMTVWYFYFRKIYFPSDPEIHGRWEWAGIYYGEKL